MSEIRYRDVFHEEEIQIQKALGVEEVTQDRGSRFIRPLLLEQHRGFFKSLHFIIIGVLDREGWPWAILRAAPTGLIESLDERFLTITSAPLEGEPGDLAMSPGAKISLVGVELETRRRNRLNGTIRSFDDETLTIEVDQSFGNCAQYIQRRDASGWRTPGGDRAAAVQSRQTFSDAGIEQLQSADAFFIASRRSAFGSMPRDGIDVNHRGGRPGFVKVLDRNTLVFPDYRGNNFFQTIGNINQDGRAALLFPDFSTGDTIYMTGRAKFTLEDESMADAYGAARYVEFRSEQIICSKGSLPFRYQLRDNWPQTPEPGKHQT